ncbi:type IV pilus modification protein PilV [Sphaerotilus uruguayifluvii]|uniref:Type IV pilus assembly protein PilV n=1 Tax=Sphaerotilus uruguayifluvii TaxID=2735897 RepID=A0ABX2G159_9BURK|nr:type IV pilus modification protein PilV [Leptothrix sp. C29]NRT55178.1 type IV pilus assembly protein PilV [Leptothrix sp. C29]
MSLHPRACRGITLIEALIALVILSLAALGYAALQMRGLSSNAGAMWRSKAVLLVGEAADRMRANQPGVSTGLYAGFTGVGGSCPVAAVCGLGVSCSAAQMARDDFDQWRCRVRDALPGGVGVICLDSTPDDGNVSVPACDGLGSTLAVKVFWSEAAASLRSGSDLDAERRIVSMVRP